MNTSYIDLLYLEDEEWEASLRSSLMICGLKKALEKAENDAIAVVNLLIFH